MSDLADWAAALRSALPVEEVPAVGAGVHRVEVTVWDASAAARVRRIAARIGIPEHALSIIRPIVFLYPYPSDGEIREMAYEQFLTDNVRTDAAGHACLLTSMAPVVARHPRILILGSMPGTVSLEAGEYNANPRNRFWRVMEQAFGVPAAAAYSERIAQLHSAEIALWDTLKHCSRVGSLDASIVARTEVPNDVEGLLQAETTIDRIIFNGRKAAQVYRRLIEPKLPEAVLRRIETVTALSTSAANSRADLATLITSWVEVLRNA